MKNNKLTTILASVILIWLWAHDQKIIAIIIIVIIGVIIGATILLSNRFGSSEETGNQKPNIITDNVTSIYIDPIWSYVVSIVLLLILLLMSNVLIMNLANWIFSNIFYIFSINDAENYVKYLSVGSWLLITLPGVAYFYHKDNNLSIKTGDCGVVTFLGDRIKPVGDTIFYLGEGKHWTIPQLISHIDVTITNRKVDFAVEEELSADNVKMRMKGFLLYGVRNPNNYAAYKEEVDSILYNLAVSASRMGLRAVSMTEGIGTVSPVTDSAQAFVTVQKMMKAISNNRAKAANTLKNKLFTELQKMSEDVTDNNNDEIISIKMGISILKKNLNILEVIPTSAELLKKMEEFVSEMFERIGEYLDLETFNEMCKGLKTAMPDLSDQEIAEIIQRNQGKFEKVETIFRGFEGFGGGKMDPATAAIIAEVLKKMGKK